MGKWRIAVGKAELREHFPTIQHERFVTVFDIYDKRGNWYVWSSSIAGAMALIAQAHPRKWWWNG